MRYRTRTVIANLPVFYSNKLAPRFATRSSGRANTGSITIRGRQSNKGHLTIKTNYFEPTYSNFVFKEYLKNTQTNKSYISVLTSNFTYYFLPCVKNISPGDYSERLNEYREPFTYLELGVPLALKYIPYFTKISNLVLYGFNQPKYALSPGTFITKLRAEKKEKLIKLRLPSTTTLFAPVTSLALIGVNEDEDSHGFMPGKAGVNRLLGKRPITRGVARNPVDHPNGGRTKSCQPEKSPWGWIAKHNK